MAKFGLRSKSLLALVFACLLALIPASFLGWYGMDGVREHFGLAYAQNLTQLNRQKILAPVSREVALSRRFADSEITRRWLLDPENAQKRDLFFKEAEGYRRDFGEHAYFIANLTTGGYYFNDATQPVSDAPRYVLSRSDPADSWFYAALRAGALESINVNPDRKLKITRVWINIVARDGDRRIGMAGASLDLSEFLSAFTGSGEAGVTPMLIDPSGAIQAHPDRDLIAFNAAAQGAADEKKIFSLVRTGDAQALRAAMDVTASNPQSTESLWVHLDGKRQLISLAYMPELNWYVLTAVDLRAARVIDTRWLWTAGIGLVVLLGIMLAGFGFFVERLVLRPLRGLQESAQAIAAGRFEVTLPVQNADEIGALTEAFSVMADRVRKHTNELESKVDERTRALALANNQMASAHKKIDDSIDYASLIQRAILPDRQMAKVLGDDHFVIWRPRDIVGGDFYVFIEDGENFLLGIMDCAGHGVPGALMTMLARAAIDLAVAEVGPRDPAAILQRTDSAMRAMLADAQLPRALATNMDAGLVYVDRTRRQLTFSGAKVALYACAGGEVFEHPGLRRALGDKRTGEFFNHEVEMPSGMTFYLVTDGFLDQAGGEHGFGFGNTRYLALVREHSSLSLAEQARAFERALDGYRAGRPQRDDITMLSFRFD